MEVVDQAGPIVHAVIQHAAGHSIAGRHLERNSTSFFPAIFALLHALSIPSHVFEN